MTQSYSNYGGSGDRRKDINVWSGLHSGPPSATDDSQAASSIAWNIVLDGSNTYTSTGPTWGVTSPGLAVSGVTILQFDFICPPRIIDEITMHGVNKSPGIAFKWQGSNDGFASDINDLTGSVDIDVTTNIKVWTLTNSTAYQSYRMLGISGSISATNTPQPGEFLFQIDDAVAVGYIHAVAQVQNWNNQTTKTIAITTSVDTVLVALFDINIRGTTPVAMTSVTDDAGNTWTKRSGVQQSIPTVFGLADQTTMEIWSARAATPGTITITATPDRTVDSSNIHVMALRNLPDMNNPWKTTTPTSAIIGTGPGNTPVAAAMDYPTFTGRGLAIVMQETPYNQSILAADFGYDHYGLELFRSRNSGFNNWGYANHSLMVLSDPSGKDIVFIGTATALGLFSDVIDLGVGVSPDGNASGAIITVDVELIPGTTADTNQVGVLFTCGVSIIAGHAEAIYHAPGDTITVTTSIALSGAVSFQAIDGGKIFEIVPSQVAATIYQTVDYDSIWSRGGRAANGLVISGEYGWITVFAPSAQAFDNGGIASGLGNGPDQSGSAHGASFWFSFADEQAVDLRGIRSIGAEQHQDVDVMWSLFGGTGVADIAPAPYTQGFDAFPIVAIDEYIGLRWGNTVYSNETVFEPRLYIPYPHYELILTTGTRVDDRLCNEFWLKVAHSNLDGGDRRPTATPSRRVAVSFSSDWGATTFSGSGIDTPQQSWFDGLYLDEVGVNQAGIGAAGHINDPVSTVGAWVRFTFPRPVTPRHIMFVTANLQTETYVGGNPQLMGRWHWEYSLNSGGSWTSIGDPWSFKENCNWMVAPRSGLFGLVPPGPDGEGAPDWRMVLEQGPAFGAFNVQFVELVFDLEDVTGQAPPLEIAFTDDVDGVPVTATIGSAGNPYSTALSDGSSDGLTLEVTNIPNPVLTIAFTDDAVFDTWSELYPSMVVQTILVSTGR